VAITDRCTELTETVGAAALRVSGLAQRHADATVGVRVREEIVARGTWREERVRAQDGGLEMIAEGWRAQRVVVAPADNHRRLHAAARHHQQQRQEPAVRVIDRREPDRGASAHAADPMEFASLTGLPPPAATFVDRLHMAPKRRSHHHSETLVSDRSGVTTVSVGEWDSVSIVEDSEPGMSTIITPTSPLAAMLSGRW
jgi:hypothetical protein